MASADASVKVIERALKMLNCFTKEKLSLSLVEIAREIDLPPSTTSRILATLEKYNYLYRDEETQRYYLGPSIARLGTLCYSHMDFRRISIPYMIQLMVDILKRDFADNQIIIASIFRYDFDEVKTIEIVNRLIE